MQKYVIFVEKEFKKEISKNINYQKVRNHFHYTGKYSICKLKFHVPSEIPVVFHNGSNYDYYFIIKELANKFEGKFECLGENTEKYKNLFCSNGKRSDKS